MPTRVSANQRFQPPYVDRATRQATNNSNPASGEFHASSTECDGAGTYDAVKACASGFLLKDVRKGQLVRAVRTVAAGDSLLDSVITRRLIERFLGRSRLPPDAEALLRQLSGREMEVLKLIAAGLSHAEIAQRLVLGESTVKTHMARILAKLQLRDRGQAVVLSYESGLVQPGS